MDIVVPAVYDRDSHLTFGAVNYSSGFGIGKVPYYADHDPGVICSCHVLNRQLYLDT